MIKSRRKEDILIMDKIKTFEDAQQFPDIFVDYFYNKKKQ